jgi:ArsR family transcriptional regulator
MHVIHVKPDLVFQALADPIRLRIVRLLVSTRNEACLCELVDSLLEPQSKLSRHVKALKAAGVLSAEKSGRWVYHRLVTDQEYLGHIHQAIKVLSDPKRVFAQDLARFRARTRLRENGRCRIGIQTEHLAA